MANIKKRGLGRGLGALLSPDDEAKAPAGDRETDPRALTGAGGEPVPESARILSLDPQKIAPNPKQPRKAFDEESLAELAQSIKRDGMQEPILVRRAAGGYELVSGERRVRASIMAGCETIPAICRDVSDRDMLKLGLIENIHREDLNPIELGRAYQALVDEFRWTQEHLAEEIGKKRATVANTLRLLNLPEEVQKYVMDGSLSMGHARALLALASPEGQRFAARRVITQGLSVRQTEKLAAPKETKPKKIAERKDANVAEIEDELRRRFGAKVTISPKKKQGGKIEIKYFDLDEFDRILNVLRGAR